MPGTDDLMAGYSNSIGGLMAGHNSMVSGLMANYNAGGGSGGGFMAGPAFTPGPGVSYGPGPMNNTGRWTPNGLPGSSWDNPFGSGFQMPTMGGLMQQQPMQQPMMPQEQQPMQQPMEQGYDDNGMRRSDGRRKVRGFSNPAARPTTQGTMPFGGFRANGGPVMPGFQYLGGEFEEELLTDGKSKQVIGKNGPEMFTPKKPAVVIPKMPMARSDYINLDRASQMKAENGMANMRQRNAMRPGGSQFSGPLMPTASIDAAFSQPTAPQGSDGRLVASSNGGVKWQQGSGAGFGAPPQSRAPAMRPIDAAFTDNSLSGRASSRDGAVRTGSLSERGATPVGSGGMTPERRMKMLARRAWTRGDDSAVAGLTQASFGMEQRGIDRAFQAGQQGEQRDFMRERDATNHAQGMQMWNLDRSFQLDAEGRRNQAALDAEQRRNTRSDQEWTRNRDAELEDRKNSAIDAPFTMTDPSGKFVIPGVKTRGGDFKPMGGAYPVKEANAGPTPAEVNQMRQDADTRGYDMVQLPSGEWKLQRKLQPSDQGSETTVYDADGKPTQRTVRTPRGGSAGSKGTGYW